MVLTSAGFAVAVIPGIVYAWLPVSITGVPRCGFGLNGMFGPFGGDCDVTNTWLEFYPQMVNFLAVIGAKSGIGRCHRFVGCYFDRMPGVENRRPEFPR